MADNPPDLLARVQRLEDIKAIEELIARYAWHVPRGEVDAVLDLFTDDGEFQSGATPVRGKVGLRAYFAALPLNLTIPIVSNILVQIAGANAQATCKMTSLWVGEGPPMVGYYEDAFQQIDGRWLFSRRRWWAHERPAAGSAPPRAKRPT
jgi:ketosteroid isomerase-like protein